MAIPVRSFGFDYTGIGKDVYLDMVIIDTTESRRVAGINVVQMDAASAFTHLRIGRGPLTRLCQISLKTFVALVIRNIKVDDDVVLRKFDIVEPVSIQLGEFSGDLFPFLSRCLF